MNHYTAGADLEGKFPELPVIPVNKKGSLSGTVAIRCSRDVMFVDPRRYNMDCDVEVETAVDHANRGADHAPGGGLKSPENCVDGCDPPKEPREKGH